MISLGDTIDAIQQVCFWLFFWAVFFNVFGD